MKPAKKNIGPGDILWTTAPPDSAAEEMFLSGEPQEPYRVKVISLRRNYAHCREVTNSGQEVRGADVSNAHTGSQLFWTKEEAMSKYRQEVREHIQQLERRAQEFRQILEAHK